MSYLIKEIKARELAPGIEGHYAHGRRMSFGYVELKKGSHIPEHHHMHEQITYIIDGQLDMIIGGNPCSLTNGMHYVIPPDMPHAAIAITDCKVIDVFGPVREEYKNV